MTRSGGLILDWDPPAFEDDPGEHMLMLLHEGGGRGWIYLSCRCLDRRTGEGAGRGCPRGRIGEARKIYTAREAIADWRAWHEQKGITV